MLEIQKHQDTIRIIYVRFINSYTRNLQI